MSFSRLVLLLSVALGVSLVARSEGTKSPYPKSYYDYYSSANPLFDLRHVDEPPSALEQPKPMRSGLVTTISGFVVVEFVVSKRGTVEHPLVVESSDDLLNEPTIQALGLSKYRPARKKGEPVNCRVRQRWTFADESKK